MTKYMNNSKEELVDEIYRLNTKISELEKSGDKVTKEEVHSSEKLFSSFFEFGNIGAAITSPDKGFIRANQKFYDLLGYSEGELKKMTWIEMTHPDDLNKDVTLFNKLLEGRIPSYELDKRFYKKDGSIIHTHITVSFYHEQEDKNAVYILATIQDISNQIQIDESIKKNQILLQQAEEISNQGAWEWDIVNDEWTFSENWLRIHGCRLTGITREELMTIAYPEDRTKNRRSFSRCPQWKVTI